MKTNFIHQGGMGHWSLCTMALATFISIGVRAQLVGNDLDYHSIERGDTRIVYSKEYKDLAFSLLPKLQQIRDVYDKEYASPLDEDMVLVLASSKNQITNGFATQYPRLMTMFYNGAPPAIDRFAMSSWADTLLIHETGHLYQLNSRRSLSTAMKAIFGNAYPNFAIPFTYMITPHLFTPTFLMEGNSTFNEGRFGLGGRLYSGYYRALFLQLLRHDKVIESRVFNDHIDFPFGTEKYILGGYFQSYVSEKFSAAKTNGYFFTHSKYYAFPLLINSSFEDHFDVGYAPLFEEFRRKYQPLADQQLATPGKALAKSYSHESFTESDDEILFMTSSYEGRNQLCRFGKSQGKLSCHKTRLPFGRVFRHQNQWVTAAYQKTHPTEIRAGLFADGVERVDGFDNKFVYQKSHKDIVYADTEKSFAEVLVYKNGVFVSAMNSSPFMDEKGDLYYFVQKGQLRGLFKNHQKLFELKGYYGRVVDIDSKGQIYFTAPVPSGVSLFSWDGRKIQKVLESDLIFDAKLLANENKVLVAEVTHEGHEYKVASLGQYSGQPQLYTYAYDRDSNSKLFDLRSKDSANSNEALEETEYTPLLELEYNGVTPTYISMIDRNLWSLDFAFSDPLQRYAADIIIGDGGFETYQGQMIFRSQAHRLNWLVSLAYDQDAVVRQWGPNDDDVGVIGRYAEHEYVAELIYPLLSHPLWKSDLSLTYIYEDEFFIDKTALSGFITPEGRTNSGLLGGHLTYTFSNLLDYEASEHLSLSGYGKYEGEGSGWRDGTSVYVAKFLTQYDIFKQSFLSGSYKAAWLDGPRAAITLDTDFLDPHFDSTDFSRRGSGTTTEDYFELRQFTAEFKQAFHLPFYMTKVPIGLHRVAPTVGYSEYYGAASRKGHVDNLFHESYYGIELELLLLHKITARLQYFDVDSSLDLDNRYIGTQANWSF